MSRIIAFIPSAIVLAFILPMLVHTAQVLDSVRMAVA